jgi:DNA-binding response OmpR family regulator
MDKSSRVILVVEDDPNDVFFLRRALTEARVELPIQVVSDGEQAIHYLGGVGKFADRDRYPLPCLVILDLKLPKKNGLEVLSWVRRHEELGDLPVFMLTSSGEPRDRSEAERHGVEVFRVKPVSLAELLQVAREIRREADEHCGSARPGDPPGRK